MGKSKVVVHKLDASGLSPRILQKYTNLCAEGWLTTKGDHTYISELVASPFALRPPMERLPELQDPEYYCWICVAPNVQSGCTTLEDGRWVGMIHMRGPQTKEKYIDLRGTTDGLTDGLEVLWRVGGLYFKPAYRDISSYKALQLAVNDFTALHALGECARYHVDCVTVRSIFGARMGHVAHDVHVANGHRQLATLTPVEELRWTGYWDSANRESLSDEDHSRKTWTIFEWCQRITS